MLKIAELLGLNKKGLKILFLSSEEAPFAKVGGLGEVMFSLPRALARLGHDVRVMIPLYGTVDQAKYGLIYALKGLVVHSGTAEQGTEIICNVKKYIPKASGKSPVITYFLENSEYYELRSNVYGYTDDRIRFSLLSRGCLEFIKKFKDWTPQVIVCSDWMTGYLPNMLKTEYSRNRKLSGIATVFSIHNLAVQGTDKPQRFVPQDEKDLSQGSLPDFFNTDMMTVNPVKRGIIHADVINTVSPTYAQEILTEKYGESLDRLLVKYRDKLYGILNGIDYETNDPLNDKCIPFKYSSRNFENRQKNKVELQKKLGLDQDGKKFIIGIVSRLSRQKGFDLLTPIMETFLRVTGAQLAVVGTGDTEIMDFFNNLQIKYPGQVAAHLQYDNILPHFIYAGCDIVLIPSKYEPSGLTQMEAMRFGAVPVARQTGGLADTVEDYDPGKGLGSGFLFKEMDPQELLIAMTRAYSGWRHGSAWKILQKRVMEKDFSWDRSAKEYAALFRKATSIRRN